VQWAVTVDKAMFSILAAAFAGVRRYRSDSSPLAAGCGWCLAAASDDFRDKWQDR